MKFKIGFILAKQLEKTQFLQGIVERIIRLEDPKESLLEVDSVSIIILKSMFIGNLKIPVGFTALSLNKFSPTNTLTVLSTSVRNSHVKLF